MAFIAGTYYGTWDTRNLGITEQGYELECVNFGELIRGDQLGDSVQDGVYRGMDWFLSATFEEFTQDGLGSIADTTKVQAAAPWNTIANFGTSGVVGSLFSGNAKAIVLTSVTGTPARAAILLGDTVTLTRAVLQEGFTTRYLLSTRLRKLPLRFRLLPGSLSASTITANWVTPDNAPA